MAMTRGKKNEKSTVTVYLIGCGLPKKSMGWFHLTQLLTMEKVVVKGIVEPYFEGVCMDVPEEWKTFKKEMEGRGITFYKDPLDLPSLPPLTLCLLAGTYLRQPPLL